MRKPTPVIPGKKFGKLVVTDLKHVRSSGSGKLEWRATCLCKCGAEKSIRVDLLRSGAVRSCGCARRRRMARLNHKHGATGTPLFQSWQTMVERCRYNPDYQARGIKVCDEWLEFAAFKKYARRLGKKPAGYSIDRIDNDRGYEPGNIRWASPKQQIRNRSITRRLTVNGETLAIAEWAERVGIAAATIKMRLGRGWTPEQAVETPVGTFLNKPGPKPN